MADHRAAQIADLAWRMFVVATDQQADPYREALRKLVRKYGESQFEAGRERESEVAASRQVDLLRDELARRRSHA